MKLRNVGAVDPVNQNHLEGLTDDLCAEFGDQFDAVEIRALMNDSVSQLAGAAQVGDFQPVLAYRFTRERLTSLTRASSSGLDVVYISLSGGGRGQIAAALTTLLSGGKVSVHAAGTAAQGTVDPVTETVIAELGVDMSEAFARPVDGAILARADVIVTMGHSVGSVELPAGVEHQDWRVGDPVGASLEEARRVRDDIQRRVAELLVGLDALAPSAEEPAAAAAAST